MIKQLMVDIHLYVIPTDFWRESLNSVSSDAVIEAISAGFIQVDPEVTLSQIRHYIYEQLQSDMIPSDFSFLRVVGRCLAKISDKQEIILRAKSFLPPFTFSPDIYIIDSRIAKRGNPRSTGSTNSDSLSLPRLTPSNINTTGTQEQDISQVSGISPVPIKSLHLERVELESSRDIPTNYVQDSSIKESVDSQRKVMEPEANNEIPIPKGKVEETLDPRLKIEDQDNSDQAHVLAIKVQLAKTERAEMEIKRKSILKRLHELQETVQQRRKEAYEYWRARFTEEKGRTPYLEEQAATLGKDIDNLHKKLVRQLGNNNSGDSALLNRQLQVLKLRQTVDLLKLKSEEGQTKLTCQIRLRNQAETELRAMRAELTQKKVLVQLLKSKLPSAADIM